jgi:hypothetical protein
MVIGQTAKSFCLGGQKRSYAAGMIALALLATSASAQDSRDTGKSGDYEQTAQSPRPATSTPPPVVNGQTAPTLAGQTGVRQSRSQVGTVPLARINNRIANRVQSRIRNRIDRNYSPSANVTSPFVVAGAQRGTVRATGS